MSAEMTGTGWTRREWMLGAGAVMGGVAAAVGATQANARSDAKASQASGAPIPIAIVLGPHATLIDCAGPWEILGAAAYYCSGFNVYSVAKSRDPIRCDNGRGEMGDDRPHSGPLITPDFTFEDAPQPRIILMGAQMSDNAAVEWIRRASKKADLTASVCTGAFLFGQTGLLDGKRATTNRNAYDSFAQSFPKVKLVRDVRFVDDGDVATATGLTAGIDLSLHIIKRFYGQEIAEKVARYEEWPLASVTADAADVAPDTGMR
ncbi:MAG TPA: DJ-1/PfpI family protein [Parvularculaceae bacterium]|nr:DJ-1/PfpI family protein [Parvularculaceae bacterium]